MERMRRSGTRMEEIQGGGKEGCMEEKMKMKKKKKKKKKIK
jgi:hypothetical protein